MYSIRITIQYKELIYKCNHEEMDWNESRAYIVPVQFPVVACIRRE